MSRRGAGDSEVCNVGGYDMGSAAFVPVSEYLHTVYRPDCDYVCGEVLERNWGDPPHAFVQAMIGSILGGNWREWGIVVLPGVRMRIAEDRYRVADISVLRRSDPPDNIVQKAPLVCIEILSPEDTFQRMVERVADYARMGVEHVWVIDPLSRRAWVAAGDGSLTAVEQELRVEGTPIRIVLADVFAELDDMLGVV